MPGNRRHHGRPTENRMASYAQQYIRTLESLGRALSPADTMPATLIERAEGRLGIRIPEALRAFHLVAGRATDFTDRHDHFLPPDKWCLHGGVLTFLAENQAVVLYGIHGSASPPQDPPVFMSTNHSPFDWYDVCRSTSEFVRGMLCWEAAFGGAMPFTATALTPPAFTNLLDQQGWVLQGEVNAMRAYSLTRRAVCHVEWSDGWRAFVGAATASDLSALASELALDFSDEYRSRGSSPLEGLPARGRGNRPGLSQGEQDD